MSPHDAGLAAVGDVDLTRVPENVRRLDIAVLTGIAAFLGSVSSLREGTPLDAGEVARQVGVVPRHAWIPGHWLDALAGEGLVHADPPRRFHGLRRFRRSELVAVRDGIEEARQALGYPPELTRYLLDSLRHLRGLLRDEVSAQALLFPDGDLATASAAYRANHINRYLNAAAVEVVRRLPETGRVLELGAGTGSLTADLLPVLVGRTREYLFTDLSPFFLESARERFGAYPFLRYERLDFNEELPGTFDLVIAVNAAHNASHTGVLLKRIAGLLAPGGTLLLIETCHEHHQSLTSMPFLLSARPGAARVERHDHRAGTTRTYLTRREWRDGFAAAGLRPVVDLPESGHPLAAYSQHLLVAHLMDRRRT
ncbi:class I SAM-dependent methyltransferase [Thermomonospora umbrina]|uniref:Methyltransferase family protein n=1 Tax=Thermomonospora umbrina TaxID=111806 RepID=A0A3D9SGN2_9ACTN|nr:class I SAM-dependent methyltransferase [Thermomonospora umbrina]REE95062.1 methyltransferase family protein [Thermomonospora umbrina]